MFSNVKREKLIKKKIMAFKGVNTAWTQAVETVLSELMVGKLA